MNYIIDDRLHINPGTPGLSVCITAKKDWEKRKHKKADFLADNRRT